MTKTLTALVVFVLAIGCGSAQLQAQDSAALSTALGHVRSVITEGEIQVSPDTVPSTPTLPLAEAAQEAGFHFGPDDEAVTCEERGACLAIGEFRGLVHVFEYQGQDPDSIVVTLRMLQFTPDDEGFHIYEQVDAVHVARMRPGAEWRISKVDRISES